MKANMRLAVSNQQQSRPYLTLINHNYTSVTDRLTDRRQSCHRHTIQHGCSA